MALGSWMTLALRLYLLRMLFVFSGFMLASTVRMNGKVPFMVASAMYTNFSSIFPSRA